MKIKNQLLLGYLIIFILMISIAGVTYRGVSALVEGGKWVAHTHAVISSGHLIEKLLVDMETGKRGFLLTGQETFLDPFFAAEKQYEEVLDDLLKLVADNPPQVERLDGISALIQKWNDEAGHGEIDFRRQMKPTEASLKSLSALIQRKTGKTIMDQLRVQIKAFIELEQELLIDRRHRSENIANWSIYTSVFGTFIAILLGITAVVFITRSVLLKVGGEPAEISLLTEKIAQGDLDIAFGTEAQSESGILAAVRSMASALKKGRDEGTRRDWLKSGIARLNEAMRGELDMATLCSRVISEITTYLDGQLGVFYLMDDQQGKTPRLKLTGSYAYTKRKNLSNRFAVGEGLVGQAALEKKQILIHNIQEDYIKIVSGLGDGTPQFITVTPIMHEDRVKGVIEIGSISEITDPQLDYLNQAMPAVAINIQTALGRQELTEALEKAQTLAEELQTQQEELRETNEELEEQTRTLQQSEQKLQTQQEELRVINEELEEKTEYLGRQKNDIEKKNRELDRSKIDLEQRAEELAIASKYKSEFLANMSHELRTPLNSLLILAQDISENKEGNLNQDQLDSVEVIHSSGKDLLTMINEILDLSKIEAGRMDLHNENIPVIELVESITPGFLHMAEDNGLDLEVVMGETVPENIFTDRKRVDQILKNLISNAVKFTENGGITVSFVAPAVDVNLSKSGLQPEQAIAIRVEDTGIGIAPEKQRLIFEAFQQVDGGTARPYGGTGLGLSISRELAVLLGGEIQLESTPGKGSTFTLYLPVQDGKQKRPEQQRLRVNEKTEYRHPRPKQRLQGKLSLPDDRENLHPDDTTILIIEDDLNFAKLLMKQCRERGFRSLFSQTGEEGLQLAKKYLPAAVILDIKLPGIDGWAVLDTLKSQPATRHIPIHVMSVENATIDTFRKGGIGHLTKPAQKKELEAAFVKLEEMFRRKIKDLLVVEDDPAQRTAIVKLIGNGDIRTEIATSGEETIQILQTRKFDCMILDLGLPDMTGFQVLKKLDAMEDITIPPVVVYTGRNLTREQEMELYNYTESIIVKGVRSEERLLDEASLFLHRVIDRLPKNKRRMIVNLYNTDALLKDKKILIADDDMRNVFALAKVLENKGMQVLKAEDGNKALELLEREKDIELVLMDIMMPVLDGYETMKKIRSMTDFGSLPIIALTAKAMKQDKERCIAAGASDYMSKPVDLDRLFAMMRVWLYR